MPSRREDKDEEVKGYVVDGETICPECIEEEELDEITKGDVLTKDDLGQDTFCARCKQRL